jgi:predicted permease
MSWKRFRSRRAQTREREEEMRAHLDLYTDELIARGRSPEDARREARVRFGNPRVKLEEVDALNRVPLVETMAGDLRMACRGLRASPGFTAVVVVVLALAMGASTTIVSVVDGTVLRGLPFPESERLVTFDQTDSGRVRYSPFSGAEFLALRAEQDVFDGLTGITDGSVTLRRDGGAEPEVLRSQRVSGDFFHVLRARPALGRSLTEDDVPGTHGRVAVLSHALWQRRFAGVSDNVGKRLQARNGEIEVIGVMPADFAYPVGAVEPTDLWVPYDVPQAERVTESGYYLRLVARLKDGVSLERAQAQVDSIARANALFDNDGGADGLRPTLRGLQTSLVDYVRPWMLLLLGAVACVLLVASINVANLLLVRATVRGRELAVRSALGATAWDLARMLLAESLLLSVGSAVLGVLAAWWGLEGLKGLIPSYVPRITDIAIDARVLMVSAGMAVLTGVAFGLAPLIQGAATGEGLKDNGYAETAPPRRQWLRGTLLVSEVALTVVLSIGAALFLTSFSRVTRIDLGFDYRDVAVIEVRTGQQGNVARLEALLERVRAIPGVGRAALSTVNVPFASTRESGALAIPGRDASTLSFGIGIAGVSPDYFRTIGMRLVNGRLFTDADRRSSAPVVVFNESAARHYFPNQDPVGQIVKLFGGAGGARTIVGVVADVRHHGPERTVELESFVPLAQTEASGGTVFVKTTRSGVTAIMPQVKTAIWSEFPDAGILPPGMLEQAYAQLISERRFTMLVLGLFGALAVVIAGVGIHGVMAYIVTQRTREIGIRKALGAQQSALVWSVLGRACTQVAAGAGLGLAMAWLFATSMERFLFQVQARELWLYATALVLLVGTALVAAFVPARRAAKVDPIIALRVG